jgi:cytochrome c oxidase cbb3-type subunit III
MRLIWLGLGLLGLGAGCKPTGDVVMRSAEQGPSVATQADAGALANLPGVVPGIHPAVVFGDLRNPYAANAGAAAEGRALFVQYNCSGCHGGRAGGGMGPSLRDSVWIYGSSDAQVYGSIFVGRPNGMPTWGAKLSRDQLWKLITYIRTLDTPQEPDPPPPQDHPPEP